MGARAGRELVQTVTAWRRENIWEGDGFSKAGGDPNIWTSLETRQGGGREEGDND